MNSNKNIHNFDAMSKTIDAGAYRIEIGDLASSNLSELLTTKYANSKKVILVDENTHEYCLPYLLNYFDGFEDAEIMLLPSGEENKVMEVCFQVWEALSEYRIGRHDLIINLGGGVVSDMGGFIASIYKRGIDFINVPTSLLAMIDASVGGKTGIDLGAYKNQLGVFAFPQALYIDPSFLSTLPDEERRNGFAEMLKHGLIADISHWNKLKINGNDQINSDLIQHSVEIKNNIVLQDPQETGLRKVLNFGHTFGHAFEGILLGSSTNLAHGHAVALGILCEAYLSVKKAGLSENTFREIEQIVLSHFPLVIFDQELDDQLLSLMQQDKKNKNREILLVLLNEIGQATYDVPVSKAEVLETLAYFRNLAEK